MISRRLVLLLLLLASACSTTPDRAVVTASVEEVAGRFIHGIETFDAEMVASAFDADAVVFQPSGPPQRFNGVEEIRGSFHALFDAGRSQGQTQTIIPRRKNLQVFGDTAILTFELGGETPGAPNPASGRFGRRTAVLHRFPDGWRIVHLHASNVQLAPPQ